MALPTTVWWDKSGAQHTGYIKDGKTFVDENASARVPVGATVQTAGGTFKMTDNGGVPTAATARNQYESKTNAAINAYKAAGQVQNERINSATDAAIAELNRQKQMVRDNRADADRAAREAYRAAANPFGAMEEQRVRLGLDESGYAESSKLKLASAYAAQVNENLRAMNNQLRDIDVQIAEAKAAGKYELANMLEARAQNIMQQQISAQGTIYSGDMQAMNMAENTRQFNEQMSYNKEQDQKEWDYQLAQDEYNKKLAKAEVLAQFGNFEGFRDLGYTPEQINMMKAAYAAQAAAQAAKSSGSRSGGSRSSGSGGSGNPKNTSDVLTTMLSFNDDSKARAYLVTLNKFDAEEREEMMELYEAAKEGSSNVSDFGSGYNSVYSNLRKIEDRNGSRDEAINILQRALDAGTLTDAGYEKLKGYFKRFLNIE